MKNAHKSNTTHIFKNKATFIYNKPERINNTIMHACIVYIYMKTKKKPKRILQVILANGNLGFHIFI